MNKKNIIILTCIIIVVFIMLYIVTPLKFNVYLWDTVPSMRHKMIQSLQNEYNLKKMNKQEIIKLCGKKDATIEDNSIVYYIKFGIFNEYFYIKFDEHNKVDYFEIYVD